MARVFRDLISSCSHAVGDFLRRTRSRLACVPSRPLQGAVSCMESMRSALREHFRDPMSSRSKTRLRRVLSDGVLQNNGVFPCTCKYTRIFSRRTLHAILL